MSRKTTQYRIIMLSILFVPICIFSTGRIQIGFHYGLILFGCALAASYIDNKWIRVFIWYLCIWQVFKFLGSMKYSTGAPIGGLFEVVTITIGGLFYQCSKNERLIDWVCIGAIVQAVIGIFQIVGLDFIEPILNLFIHTGRTDPYSTGQFTGIAPAFGTLGVANVLAAYLAVSVPLFFRKKWAWWLILIVPVLLFSRTSTAVGAALVGVAFYFRKLKYLWVCAILAVLYSIIENWARIGKGGWDIGSVFLTGRPEEWVFILKNSFRHIWFGAGPGEISRTLSFVHSEYLGTLFQYGIAGLILMIGYIATVKRSNRILFSSLLIAFIDFLAFWTMHHPVTALQVIVIGGLNEKTCMGD